MSFVGSQETEECVCVCLSVETRLLYAAVCEAHYGECNSTGRHLRCAHTHTHTHTHTEKCIITSRHPGRK